MSSQILTPDTPRGIRIVLVVNRKGGAGKSTFVKALASAAAERGETVTIFDTDTSQSNYKWMQRAKDAGLWSDTVKVTVSGDVDAIAEMIGQISEMPDQEHLILIDTYGGASPAYEQLIALADMALVPLPAAEDDFQETKETFEWTQRVVTKLRNNGGHAARVFVVMNKIQRPDMQSDLEAKVAETAFNLFPMLPAFLAYRAAYKDMSAYGLLGQIAATKRTRALAAHVNRALAEATDFLDTMDAARLGLSMPEVEHG